MAEAAETEPTPPKRSRLPLLLGLAGAVLLGGAGFYAVWSGLIGATAQATEGPADLPDIAFVPVDPVIISLPPGSTSDHLRFTAQLEVESPHRAEVAALTPRILDVMNSYLRAVDVAALQDPAALVRIRAQLLRRLQIVTGEGRVRDLLVTEFILN